MMKDNITDIIINIVTIAKDLSSHEIQQSRQILAWAAQSQRHAGLFPMNYIQV